MITTTNTMTIKIASMMTLCLMPCCCLCAGITAVQSEESSANTTGASTRYNTTYIYIVYMFIYALYMFKDRLYMFVYMYICIVYVWMLKTHCICSLYLFVCCYTKESSDNTIEANKCTKHKVQDIYIIHTRSNQAQHTYAKQAQYKNNIVIKLNWNKNNNQKSKHAVQICFKEYKYCDPNIVQGGFFNWPLPPP